MFVPIIEKSTFDGIGMPYNLLAFTADSDGNPREPLVIDVGSNSEYFGNKYIVPTFDETFWITYEVSSVVVPWLPYFMN